MQSPAPHEESFPIGRVYMRSFRHSLRRQSSVRDCYKGERDFFYSLDCAESLRYSLLLCAKSINFDAECKKWAL